MIKNVVIFGLGWQGKQFIRYFLKNDYIVTGICKTLSTKKTIEKEYGIKVFNDYNKALSNKIDLLVLCAYPIDVYDEIINYSKKYNYKILADLPISFDINIINNYISNEKIFLFLLETKLDFSNTYLPKYKKEIKDINCVLLQNKDNIKLQKYKKESIIVDTQYMLNNLLGIDYNILNISYKFVERKIKNVEYYVEIVLNNNSKIIYKYEDGKGISIFIDDNGDIIDSKIQNIVFDFILDKYLYDLNLNINVFKKEYFKSFIYLLTKLKYEKKKYITD